jgi:hypothetical protein
MRLNFNEKGQAGLEFVIVAPVLMLAIILLAIVGNQLYQKLTAQTVAYSHCVWEIVDINLLPGGDSAGQMVFDQTKKTWNTEGLWEDYFWQEYATKEDLFTKKCVGSVTFDEWGIVGSRWFTDYDPDVLVESKLVLSRTKYQNREPRFLNNLLIWTAK